MVIMRIKILICLLFFGVSCIGVSRPSNTLSKIKKQYFDNRRGIFNLSVDISRLTSIISVDLSDKGQIEIIYKPDTAQYQMKNIILEKNKIKALDHQIISGIENNIIFNIIDSMQCYKLIKMSVEDNAINYIKRSQVEIEVSRDLFTSHYYKIFIPSIDDKTRIFFHENLVKNKKGDFLDNNAIWYVR